MRRIMALLALFLGCAAANATSVLLSDVPDYAWTYGCSPTSATMLIAYYDLNGYDGLSYANLIAGTAPLSTYTSSSATITSAIYSMATDMATNLSTGGSSFYAYSNGAEFTATDSARYGYSSGVVYGLWEYVKNAGYSDSTMNFYNQLIYSASATLGYTFADYVASINAGMPVLIELSGHTMLGYGYDAATETIYVLDTWDSGGGTMTWGGSYGGYQMIGVTVAEMAGGTTAVTPEPGSLLLLGTGMLGLGFLVRRRRLNI